MAEIGSDWQLMADASRELVMLLDPERRITKANAAAVAFFGLPKEKLIGEHCYRLMHGTSQPPDVCPLGVSGQCKKHAEIEHFFKERGVWALVTVDPIFNDKEELTGFVHRVIDITGRKRVEAELLANKAQNEYILNNIPIFVALIDESGKFVVWNRYAEKLLGHTAAEAVGKLTPLDIHETKADADEVIRVASEKGLYDKEIRMKRKDGVLVPVRLVAVPNKDASGKIVGFSGFVEDITEQKEAENKLKEKMDELKVVNDLAVGRELKMIELEKEIDGLLKELGRATKYK